MSDAGGKDHRVRRVGTLAVLLLLCAVAVALGFFGPFRSRPQTLRLPGVVEIQEVRIGSKVGGRVAEVLIQEGDVAEEGQLLVRFEAPELKAQKMQQQARIAMMEADWRKAENGFRKEGFASVISIEVPGVGHAMPGAAWLEKGLEFLDTGKGP